MANELFDIYKEALLGEGNHGNTLIDIGADTIVVSLIDTGVKTPNLATDEDEDDYVGPDPRIGVDQTLTTPTGIDGVFDADDATFPTVSGLSVEMLLIWKDTGTPGTSPVMVLFDTATGLPVTPNGGDIVIQWNGSGIFSF